MPLEKYQVTVERPKGVGIREMQAYIDDAVGTWKGCYHPDDPIFNLDYTTIKVRRIKEAQ